MASRGRRRSRQDADRKDRSTVWDPERCGVIVLFRSPQVAEQEERGGSCRDHKLDPLRRAARPSSGKLPPVSLWGAVIFAVLEREQHGAHGAHFFILRDPLPRSFTIPLASPKRFLHGGGRLQLSNNLNAP